MPLEYLSRIAQTAAPTFFEGKRANLLLELWRELGAQTELDAAGNVIARLGPEAGPLNGGALVLAAHLDTVFSSEVDLTVQKGPKRWTGAGLGDNSSSLAVLTAFLRDFCQSDPQQIRLRRPLWLVANVGEEGLGDLRGAKALLEREHKNIATFVAVDGYLGLVVTRPVGVKRYRASFQTAGGHSWGDRSPSAIRALGLAINALYGIPLPSHPRTTLNVGTVEGGTSVNSIAPFASLLLDLRSLEGESLSALEKQAIHALEGAAMQAEAKLVLERVGDRPGGDLNNAALLKIARAAASDFGLELQSTASSTDANAAAPYGIPALALGVYEGGNAHRLDEWVRPDSLARGKKLLERFVELYQNKPLNL